MNKAEDAVGQERVILWKDIEANDPRCGLVVAAGL